MTKAEEAELMYNANKDNETTKPTPPKEKNPQARGTACDKLGSGYLAATCRKLKKRSEK